MSRDSRQTSRPRHARTSDEEHHRVGVMPERLELVEHDAHVPVRLAHCRPVALAEVAGGRVVDEGVLRQRRPARPVCLVVQRRAVPRPTLWIPRPLLRTGDVVVRRRLVMVGERDLLVRRIEIEVLRSGW